MREIPQWIYLERLESLRQLFLIPWQSCLPRLSPGFARLSSRQPSESGECRSLPAWQTSTYLTGETAAAEVWSADFGKGSRSPGELRLKDQRRQLYQLAGRLPSGGLRLQARFGCSLNELRQAYPEYLDNPLKGDDATNQRINLGQRPEV